MEELSGALARKRSLSLKQWEKIYQCCVRPVLLYRFERWELSVADEARLPGVERRMIRTYRVRQFDRVLTDILRDKVGVVVKIEYMIIQSCLWWYGHVMHRDIYSQIREVMEVKITEKRKKDRPRKL